MRMCAGCRERKPKRDMVRVVRLPQGTVQIDAGGKMAGRGVYLCMDKPQCLQRAMRSKALERSLEVAIGEDVFKQLQRQLQDIQKDEDEHE